MPIHSEEELAILRDLMEAFQDGRTKYVEHEIRRFLPSNQERRQHISMLNRLIQLGALKYQDLRIQNSPPTYTILPAIIDLVGAEERRQEVEQEQADRIARTLLDNKKTLHERFTDHPVVGVLIIVGSVLLALSAIAQGVAAIALLIEKWRP